jgi:hypothetical protein
MDSYPPQCGGLDLTNWSWDGNLASERASGTRWGEYVVVGTYDRDAQTFTLTRAARDVEPRDRRVGADVDLSTPCSPPASGWPPATESELSDAASRLQVRQTSGDPTATTRGVAVIDGFGGVWLSRNPFVLNVRVVGDVAAADAAIREFYDGPLCLVPSERTYAELVRIQNEVDAEWQDEMTGTSPDVITGQVQVWLFAPNPELERQLVDRYGDAVSVIVSGLAPIAPGEDPDPGPGSLPPTVPSLPSDTIDPDVLPPSDTIDAGLPLPRPPSTQDDRPGRDPVTDTTFSFSGTVDEEDEQGAHLCIGARPSIEPPPPCGGPLVGNWDWSAVEHATDGSRRSGGYTVVGTYDPEANTFMITETPTPPAPEEPDEDVPALLCPEPPGGWDEADPEQLVGFYERIHSLDGFAGLYGHQTFVYTVLTTGDVATMEADVRGFYDGPLCVGSAERSYAELERIRDEISTDVGSDVLSVGPDDVTNTVTVELLWPDPDIEAELEQRYGDAVRITDTALTPLD